MFLIQVTETRTDVVYVLPTVLHPQPALDEPDTTILSSACL